MLDLGAKETARSPEVQEKYNRHRIEMYEKYGDNMPCPFCDMGERKILEELPTMVIVENDFPYATFDGQVIKNHRMIVPRRHISLLADLNSEELQDYWGLMVRCHKNGFSSMTRSAVDVLRSVPGHLHTHLFSYTQG